MKRPDDNKDEKKITGCKDHESGLYFREHFFLSLNYELARLDRYQKGLGLLLIHFPLPGPDWKKIGPGLNAALGSCDQAACLDQRLAAVLLPETGPKKVARILEDLNRELGSMAQYALTLVWPGQMVAAEELLTRTEKNLAHFEKTRQKLIDEHGPWSTRETALIPEEKDSLFEGFGQLLADG